jgi:S-adenosylmethionine decarboxylase
LIDSLPANSRDRLLLPVGIHCILELYGCPATLLNDAAFIQQTLREGAEWAESTLIDEVAHQFHPHGVTALALLAESHISIHTWPETGYAAADIFTCGAHTKPEKACQYFVKMFQADQHLLLKLPRRSLTPHSQSAERWILDYSPAAEA